MKKGYVLTALLVMFLGLGSLGYGQTPYVMSGGNYSETFTNIANTSAWPNGFNGTDCAEWAPVAVNASGTVGDGVKISTATTTFVTGSTGGVQRGSSNIYLLSTSTANSCAIDLLLDFTGRAAGTISFDVATVFNSTGDRDSKLRLFYSTDGSTFTELTGTNLPYTARNNVSGSASISSISLPSAFNNSSTARLRFYEHSTNTGATPTGSQPKISIDNIIVTSIASEPTTQASSINFTSVGTTGFTVNWTIGNGSSRAVFMKQGTGAITNPTDGTTYTASSDWNSKGTQLAASGYYCIYNSTGSSVAVTNLSPNTAYYVQVFEYNGSGTTANYYTATATNNPNNQTTNAASEPSLTISHAGLTEENLSGAVVSLTLANETFADGSLSTGNFTLNDAPTGVTVNSVEYLTTTTANCTLAYAGTDFDANVTTFSISVAGAELTLGNPLTSNNLTITATVETAPTVTTNASITTNGTSTATWGGEVTATGGESVTQKGLVWKTSTGPTTDDSKTEEGAGTGTIIGNMTGLTPNTTYYVRAYATNSVGTAYGTEYNFTTNGLSAPTANAGSLVASTSFTANWDAVTDASSYRLDVSQYSNFSNTTNATDLFISEYVEGSSNNKYIEIFNGTGSTVDLSNYKLRLFNNGASSPSQDVALSGNLENGSVLVYKNSSAALTLPDGVSATNSAAVAYNGDDAVALYKISSDGYVDIFGVIGNDPGTNWTSTSNSTVDKTLRRKSSVTGGVTTNPSGTGPTAFTTLESEWDQFNIDVVSDLGSHTYGTASYVSGYENLTVNGTSQSVTGLSAGTNYYYRVRGYSATSTSSNSSTITVTTANSSQSANIASTGNVQVTSLSSIGVGEINFSNVTTPGDVSVNKFNSAPSNVSGVTGNVSQYRWTIEAVGGLVFQTESGYTLRFDLANIPNHGISELENGNNTSIKLYKRSTPGSGAFTGPITLTYNRNGTDGNQADDYLTSANITTGFSEFVFGSEDNPLPVEMKSFTANSVGNAVVLNWSTATEVNNYGFEIQRTEIREQGPFGGAQGESEKNWTNVGFVQGNGNSNSEKAYSFTDRNVASSTKYIYRLKQIDTDGKFDYSNEVEVLTGMPDKYALAQNYPNPFNPSTVISYQLMNSGNVKLVVYDILGKEIAQLVNGKMDAGSHSVDFNASGLQSGIYFYKITVTGSEGSLLYSSTSKMSLIK